jgi:hypothetical protein
MYAGIFFATLRRGRWIPQTGAFLLIDSTLEVKGSKSDLCVFLFSDKLSKRNSKHIFGPSTLMLFCQCLDHRVMALDLRIVTWIFVWRSSPTKTAR